ncbi:mucin-binding protein [Levilactobacillus lindianensis]|uniref:mucin-binding protein n=1 Tax=Levilactobacillus lindianensis TaxID=2486018 RepID=UPI000F73EE29|nr:LPXTG cell wall anchor domain-containing protein [Levilactobacillus lindianensis]
MMKNFERKTHYKMYKSHKGWLVAGVTVASLAVGVIAGPQATQTAKAADDTPGTESVDPNKTTGEHSEVPLKKTSTPQAPVAEKSQEPETPAPDNEKTAPKTPDSSDKVEEQPATGVPTPEAESLDEAPEQTHTAPKTNVQTGIVVKDPTALTDPVTGQPAFNVSKTDHLQYTYDHSEANGLNSDLRVKDGYSPTYQAPTGYGYWLGETYANNIAQDAKGMDVNSPLRFSDGTHPLYIDEWMPDNALQNFLWLSNFSKTYATIADFRANFTKADLATVTNITADESLMSSNYDHKTPTVYYKAMMAMYTLEGMQNATNLQVLDLYPDVLLNQATFGTAVKNGNLWDIRALSGLTKLKKVALTAFSINDISALGNKDTLTSVDLPYNQITDISPLATDKNVDIKNVGLAYQHVLLAPITVSSQLAKGEAVTVDGLLTYTTPSFIIKDLTSSNLPIKGFDNPDKETYPSLYPSSADTGNVNDNTLSWYNLQKDSTNTDYGSLSTIWSDPNSSFAGYIIQPYDLAENVSDINVNIQLLQADGQQLTLAPSTLISGEVGSELNVGANPTVISFFNQQIAKGYTFSNLILDGTGLYSDYLAGNGKANRQPSFTTTLTKDSKNWTLLFYKDVMPWNLSVIYAVQNADGTVTQLTNADGTPMTDSHNGTSDEQLTLSSYQKDLPDYVYTGAQTSVDGKSWTDVSQDTTVPFAGPKQTLLMVYKKAAHATVTVKDATTGKTIQVLDDQSNPELKGALGTTSTFDSATVINPALAKGYTLVSDTTKNADGTSAITFTDAPTANLDYTITLAHAFKTATKVIHEQINYQNAQQQSVADPVSKAISFATVTDQVTNEALTYWKADATADPELSTTGQPTDSSWVTYKDGDTVAFDAVADPVVSGMHVTATTDVANDLTQTTAQSVTPESTDLAVVVTYAPNATTGGNGDNGGGTVTPPAKPDKPSTGGNGAQVTPGKKPSKPVKPSTNGQKPAKVSDVVAGGEGAQVQNLATASKQVRRTELPQTSEKSAHGFVALGLMLLSLLASLFGWRKRDF